MKKKSVKKLTLGKETITDLRENDVKEAAGGRTIDNTCCVFSCMIT